MGGSIRKDMVSKVTHLIANCCGGEKYQYAVAFRVPVMSETWINTLWERRNDISLNATNEEMVCISATIRYITVCCFYVKKKSSLAIW